MSKRAEIVLPADAEWLTVEEIPGLIATALYSDANAVALSRADTEEKLKKAILGGQLKSYSDAMIPLAPIEGIQPTARIVTDDFIQFARSNFPLIDIRTDAPAQDGTPTAPSSDLGVIADSLIVVIDEREAIPVRAIPYVTCWAISPDAVALEFAGKVGAPFAKLEGLQALHLKNARLVATLSKEWEGIVAALQGLEAELRFRFPDNAQGYAVWRDRAAGKLPAGVFVWRNEFEAAYLSGTLSESSDSHIVRQGDHPIIYTPMLDDDTYSVVLDGFSKKGTEHALLVGTGDSQHAWYSGRLSVQELTWNIASVLVDANPTLWHKEGSDNWLRRDIAIGFVQSDVAKHIRQMAESRQIHPAHPMSGRPLEGDSQWDDSWLLTYNEAVLIRKAVPLSLEMTLQPFVEQAATRTETWRAIQHRQAEDKKAAGRLTLKELAATLSKHSGITPDRWRHQIEDDIRVRNLKLRNPRNFADNLPYDPPKQILHFYEQTWVDEANRWLDANPDWMVTFRFSVEGSRKTAQIESASNAAPSSNAPDRSASAVPDNYNVTVHHGIAHIVEGADILAAAGDSNISNRDIGIQAWQEQEIVRVLRILGHNPILLPPYVSGMRGVKSDAYKKCIAEDANAWFGKRFEKAWERLRKLNEIRYANE